MDSKTLRKAIIAVRVSLGVGSIVLPRVTGRIFGINAAENPASPFLARLFGLRELFMAWLLYTADDVRAREVLTAGVLVDVSDSVAALAAGQVGYLPTRAAIMSAATGMTVSVVGVLALRGLDVSEVEWIEIEE